MIIAFHTPNLNFRGSCVALREYALYNETLLNNRSIIVTDSRLDGDDIAFRWFTKRFPLYCYGSLDELESILEQNNCDMLYCIKYGVDDGVISVRIRTAIHCVFDMSQPHGDVYAGVSESLAKKFNSSLFVPHIVASPPIDNKNLRRELNISDNAIVFGRHGGRDTFNLEWAKTIFSRIVRERSDIYFIFLNADVWDNHPQIIHLDATTDTDRKYKFIRTCDAMVVPETMGHTFGKSIAEFSVCNKPVLIYNGSVWNRAHIDIMGDRGIYFSTPDQLYDLICEYRTNLYKHMDLNAYRDFNPKKVMKKFKQVFIDQ